MELKFAAAARPDKIGVNVQRRQKLVRRIDQQIGYASQMLDGQSPRGAWFWMDESGSYFLPIHYGRRQIEMKKGMFSVACTDLEHVRTALGTIRAMVLAGKFDEQLAAVSTEIRSRFRKD